MAMDILLWVLSTLLVIVGLLGVVLPAIDECNQLISIFVKSIQTADRNRK